MVFHRLAFGGVREQSVIDSIALHIFKTIGEIGGDFLPGGPVKNL